MAQKKKKLSVREKKFLEGVKELRFLIADPTSSRKSLRSLLSHHGVKPENIPADLAEVGILPSPLPSNQWTAEQVQKAFAFYSKPQGVQRV